MLPIPPPVTFWKKNNTSVVLKNNSLSISGNTASGGNTTLTSTSHATKGKILFGTSAYDEVNNRLGIGTNNPSDKLSVVGGISSSDASNPYFAFYKTGGTPKFWYFQYNTDGVAGVEWLLTGSPPILRMTDTGLLGIGTISPTAKLEITTAGGNSFLALTNSATAGYSSYVWGVNTNGNNSDLDLYEYRPDGNSGSRITLKSNGNVGISVSVPTALLHLKAGTATASTAPIKLTAGTNLTTPESGAVEWSSDLLYITDSGALRREIYKQGGTDVAVADGGTGASTFTLNGILYGNTTSAIQVTAQGGANTVLIANAGVPSFSASPTIGTSVTCPLLIGSAASGGNLTLQSTSHATKGKIYLGVNSLYDEVNDFLGIGATPINRLTLNSSVADTIPALGANGGKFGMFNGLSYGLIAGVLDTGNVFFQVQRIDATATAYNILLNPNGGKVGIGITSPTAILHLKAGTATANTAPLKFTAGTLNTTPESGAMEWFGDLLHITDSGALRREIYKQGGTDVAVADGGTGKSSWTQYLIPYADTTTSFSQIAIGTAGQVLTSNGAGSAPTFQAAGQASNGFSATNLFFQVDMEDPECYVSEKTATNGTLAESFGGIIFSTTGTQASRVYVDPYLFCGTSGDIWQGNPVFSQFVRVTTEPTTGEAVFGIGGPTISQTTGITWTNNHAGFKIIYATSTATISATNGNGTTETATDITAGLTATTGYYYSCVGSDGVNFKYYVNGTLKATHTTNLPGTANEAVLRCGVTNVDTATTYAIRFGQITYMRDMTVAY